MGPIIFIVLIVLVIFVLCLLKTWGELIKNTFLMTCTIYFMWLLPFITGTCIAFLPLLIANKVFAVTIRLVPFIIACIFAAIYAGICIYTTTLYDRMYRPFETGLYYVTQTTMLIASIYVFVRIGLCFTSQWMIVFPIAVLASLIIKFVTHKVIIS